jgi:hypothetical protein
VTIANGAEASKIYPQFFYYKKMPDDPPLIVLAESKTPVIWTLIKYTIETTKGE